MNESSSKKTISLGMILVTIGIVYGDIGTSPMYVMKSIVAGNGGIGQVSEDFIIGSLSLVMWTITLLTTVKYVLIAMKADNCGEGGIFSLYTLVKDCAKWLIVPAMLGGAALLADGMLTPAVTVTTAIEGLRSIPSMDALLGEGQLKVILITLVIISTLFAVQHSGTSKIGRAFGPAMLIWFGFLGYAGVSELVQMPSILRAFNPVYAVQVLLSPSNKAGFMILGSVFLATTGAEALYSDMGHVGKENIYITWPFVNLCLFLNYLGQGSWIIRNSGNDLLASVEDMNPFFMMLPDGWRPFAVILGSAAAIIASQALITGSFTLVSEAIHLNLLPHLEIKYPSDTKGQLYIDRVNSIMWLGCCLVVLYFRSGARIESAYGLAITLTMLMTTLLLSVYLFRIRSLPVLSVLVLLVFGALESVFFVSSLGKFAAGGYVTVIITLLILLLEIVWYRGTELEKMYSTQLNIREYIPNLSGLHNDHSYPMMCNNLVYLINDVDPEIIDRAVLYSILDKDPKRSQAYWLVHINVTNEPMTATYNVETYGTDFIFRITFNLGFKQRAAVNVFLRQVVQDLLASGEMPKQEKPHSIYPNSVVGNFKFVILHKTIPSKTDLDQLDELILDAKYLVRSVVGDNATWFGLDTSSTISEKTPLIINPQGTGLHLDRVDN